MLKTGSLPDVQFTGCEVGISTLDGATTELIPVWKQIVADHPDSTKIYTSKCSGKNTKRSLTRISRYTQNGILHMLDRNRRIKKRPERFQSCPDHFDIIVSCEERVYDQIIEDLMSRDTETGPVHVINIDIQDNHEEATIGAFIIVNLMNTLADCEDLDNEIDEILQEFEHTSNRTILHTVSFC